MKYRQRWTRRDGKRPIRVDGRPASSTRAETWTSYEAATGAASGDGVGFMLGDGIGCIDLDHCLTAGQPAKWARDVIESTKDIVFMERSLSGNGVHVFHLAPQAPGRVEVLPCGGRIERYSQARFIAVTGDQFTLQ